MADDSHPLVAVVTPVFNGAPYLMEALSSVQAQTWPNLVHVVLDNASDDETPEIIARQDGSVPLVVKRNPHTLPLAQNWNAAIGLVPPEAKYFRLLCADDLIDPEAVEKQVRLAESDPAIGAVGTLMRFGSSVADLRWPGGKTVYDGHEALSAYFREDAWAPGIHTLWRRDLLGLRQPFFDADVLFLDVEVCLLAWANGWRFGLVREPLGLYRVHDRMLSASAVYRDQRHLLDFAVFLERYGRVALTERDFADLRRAFRRYHVRRLAIWRSSAAKRAVAALHLSALQAIDRAPDLAETAEAFVDWALRKARLRPPSPKHPWEAATPRA